MRERLHDDERTRAPEQERRKEVVRRAPLRVGAADDRAEREADAVAGRVVENLGMGSPVAEVTESRVQRKATGAIGPEGGEVDADTQAKLDQSNGRGSALDTNVRRSMEGCVRRRRLQRRAGPQRRRVGRAEQQAWRARLHHGQRHLSRRGYAGAVVAFRPAPPRPRAGAHAAAAWRRSAIRRPASRCRQADHRGEADQEDRGQPDRQ